MTPPHYSAWVWLTCTMCGGRYQVDRDWWAGIIVSGGKIEQCQGCHPAAHHDAPPPPISVEP